MSNNIFLNVQSRTVVVLSASGVQIASYEIDPVALGIDPAATIIVAGIREIGNEVILTVSY